MWPVGFDAERVTTGWLQEEGDRLFVVFSSHGGTFCSTDACRLYQCDSAGWGFIPGKLPKCPTLLFAEVPLKLISVSSA